MPYDPQKCLEKLKEMGLTPACGDLDPPYHCDDWDNPPIHRYCMDMPTGGPVQMIACIYYENNIPQEFKYWPYDQILSKCLAQTPQKGSGDTGWNIANCYCCCGLMGAVPTVALAEGEATMHEVAVGSEVRTARLDSGGKPEWTPAPVTFSAGVASLARSDMVRISHGDEPVDMVCNPDQVLALASGKLVRAAQLTPEDRLMAEDGSPVTINRVAVGEYRGGIHQIAVGDAWNGSADGHLLLTSGVVTGDFTLQINYDSLPESQKAGR
ncbi:MAG TPA: hypothetical protein VF574_08315 [Allosphingosinicella sp.]|jgi:hypothetical protein